MKVRQILGLSFALALILVKGCELVFVAMILKHAPHNPPVLSHRYATEINSIALGVVGKFVILKGHDLR